MGVGAGLYMYVVVVQKLCDGAQMANFWRFFWVLHFQQATWSIFQTCILNSH